MMPSLVRPDIPTTTGEVAAIPFGLCWAADFSSHAGARGAVVPTITIEYDSQYAADVIRKIIRPRTNLSISLRARDVMDQVAPLIQWRKVASHTGQFLNERADLLANCGAGQTCAAQVDLLSP